VVVREEPGTDAPVSGRASADTAGAVVDAVEADGVPWYEIEWTDGGSGWSPAGGVLFARFGPGQPVTTTDSLAVRAAPGATAHERAVAPEGTDGEILDGPVDDEGYRWWRIDYDGVETGWSVGYWLQD
jgi:hypothetical protein